MAHILAFLMISILKIIKWALIKSGLFIVVIPAAVVLLFYEDWCNENMLLADLIGLIMISVFLISWIITLAKYIKVRKQNKIKIARWAYERYSNPNMIKMRISKK